MSLGLVKAVFERSLRETQQSPGVVDNSEAGQIVRAGGWWPGRDTEEWLKGRLGEDDAGFYDSRATHNRLRRYVGMEPLPAIGKADLNTIKRIFTDALSQSGAIDGAKAKEIINRAGRFPTPDVREWLKGRAGADDRGFYDNDDTFNMMRAYVGLAPIYPDQPPASLADVRGMFTNALGDIDSPGVVSWNEAQAIMRAAGRAPLDEVKQWLTGRAGPDDVGFYESRAVFNAMRNYLGMPSIIS